jgi:hypothetical protein
LEFNLALSLSLSSFPLQSSLFEKKYIYTLFFFNLICRLQSSFQQNIPTYVLFPTNKCSSFPYTYIHMFHLPQSHKHIYTNIQEAKDTPPVTNYLRSLDMDTALATTSFDLISLKEDESATTMRSQQQQHHSRESFLSYPHKVSVFICIYMY